jgi:hypothetical protein
MTAYDVIAFDAALAVLLASSFFLVLGLAAAVVESIPWRWLALSLRCRLRYWGLRWDEWRTRHRPAEGDALIRRAAALKHDSEYVIGGKPRF